MSIYYDIKEHLCIPDTSKQDCALSVYSHRLVRIGALVIEDNARFNKLLVIADGERYEFSGDTMTENFHNIIRKINRAESVEIFADYGYMKYGLSATAPEALDMTYHLDSWLQESDSDDLDGLFYSIYHNADCSENAGALMAYGEHNDTFYVGPVKEKEVDALPDGVWYSPQTAVIYDVTPEELKNAEETEKICCEMTKFSSYDELSLDESGFSFYLNNLEIKANDELVSFLELCKNFNKVTESEFPADEFNFVDLNSDDGRIASVRLLPDGTTKILITTTESL